ncbi:oxidoreductase [Pontixanthobacter gangjinensis]|uniref:SDR family NAD(P)-dependent oxidoreductase n=1 Tax=Christiangramia aestuarii TaxID=1028746 RepID=A0A7K1LSD8_9FLAO|nr:oxidoreductase [Christiangramia aestuarii]MUP43722.1 SDR family NAD(P)-dependent oxidoreductase [Christiangramia aestuarii]
MEAGEKRIWFITGISSGLGKALAQSVIDSGDFMIGTFRTRPEVVEFNRKNSQSAYAVRLDLTDQESIGLALKSVMQKFGRIDVLVNNAGIGFAGAIEEASEDEVRNVFEINFFGTLNLTRQILPIMRKQRKGHIIQISSHAGVKSFPGFGIYNASKFALEGFSEALAQEIEPLGIRLTIVEPGPFRTEFAGKGLLTAANMIAEYSETAGAFRKKLKEVHGIQEGDPVKAGRAIIDMVNSKKSTLRLPLGKTPLTTIQMKIDSLQSDLDANKEIAESVIF